MIPKDIYEPLLISDIAIMKGKVYRAIPSLSKVQNIDQRVFRRLNYWINKIQKEEIKDTIFAYRITTDAPKAMNKFLFDDLSNVKLIKNNFINYSSNLAELLLQDYTSFKKKQGNNWRIKDPLNSYFMESYSKKEFEPLFYIMINNIFGLTKLWEKHAQSQSFILEDTIKLLENGYTLINTILNLDLITHDKEYIELIGDI